MGRFTSVQAYADNNANLRKLTYEQATGGAAASSATVSGSDGGPKQVTGTVKTEKVVNPYGSTAGAGSGEFHVYRHARARELQRWKHLDEQQKQQIQDQEFQRRLQEEQEHIQSRTEKNRKKRQREKEAKLRKKNLKAAGIDLSSTNEPTNQEDEFTYVPLSKQQQEEEAESKKKVGDSKQEEASKDGNADAVVEIRNDGSFLEMMKEKLKQQQPQQQSSSLQQRVNDYSDDEEEGPKFSAKAVAAATATTKNNDGSEEANPPPKKQRIIETKIMDEEF